MGLAAAEGLELLRQRADVRHEPGRQRDRHDVDLGEVASGMVERAQQVLGVQDADDVLRLVAPDGMRVNSALRTALTISSAESSALTVVISVRWTMTSGP